MGLVKLNLITFIIAVSLSGLIAQSNSNKERKLDREEQLILEMLTNFGIEHGRMPKFKEDLQVLKGMPGYNEFANSLGAEAATLNKIFELYKNQDDIQSYDQLEQILQQYPILKALLDLRERPKKKTWIVDYAKKAREDFQNEVEKGRMTQAQVDMILTPEQIKEYDAISKEYDEAYYSMLGTNKRKKKEEYNVDFIKIMSHLGLIYDSNKESDLLQLGSGRLFQATKDYASDRFSFNSYFEFQLLNDRSYGEYFNDVITKEELLLHHQRLNRAQYYKDDKCQSAFEEAMNANLNFKLLLNPKRGMSFEEKIARFDKRENPKLFQKLDKLCAPRSFVPSTFKEIQNLLESYEAMVVVSTTSEDKSGDIIYTYSIIRAGEKEPHIIKLNDGVKLETSYLESYKEDLDRTKLDTKVYEYYWKYVDKHLSDITKIYLVPDGIYHLVNVGVLPAPEANLKFITDKYEVVHLATPSSLRNIKGHNSKVCSSVRIFGNFEYGQNQGGPYGFKSIKESHEEISAILNLSKQSGISDDSISFYVNGSETDVESGSAQVMHFATHSFLDTASLLGFSRNQKLKKSDSFFSSNLKFRMGWTTLEKSDPYFRSGLALANANHYKGLPGSGSSLKDGILHAYEISNLDLRNTDLVFINSCNSEMKDIKNGLGVYGLQRAFFEAGVNSIIMTTSKVSNEVSQMFAKKFYESYFFKRKSKTDSFDDAIRFVRYNKEKLENWGGFRMVSY